MTERPYVQTILHRKRITSKHVCRNDEKRYALINGIFAMECHIWDRPLTTISVHVMPVKDLFVRHTLDCY